MSNQQPFVQYDSYQCEESRIESLASREKSLWVEKKVATGELSLYDMMRKVVSGLMAKGHRSTGFTHGSVTVSNGILQQPGVGTSDADFEIACLEDYAPTTDYWVVMYNCLIWVFLYVPQGESESGRKPSPTKLSLMAREAIMRDMKDKTIIFQDL